jgi:hypothetical protein
MCSGTLVFAMHPYSPIHQVILALKAVDSGVKKPFRRRPI